METRDPVPSSGKKTPPSRFTKAIYLQLPTETQAQDPSHPLVGRQIDADQLLLNHFPEAWQLG